MATFPFTILVSGAGSIGHRHARNLREIGVERLVLCDIDASRASSVAEEISAESYDDFERALDAARPDIVFICTPPSLHVPQAMMAARRGAHLFVEKPLSQSIDGIDALERAASERFLVTMVGCNMRFHPGPAAIKTLLLDGAIGSVLAARIETASYLPHWRPQQDYTKSYSASPTEGGAVLDCIHEIDLALWYLGSARMEHAVTLSAKSIGLPETDGLAEILLRHEHGAISSVHLSFVSRGYRRACRIAGSDGTIDWDFKRGTVELFGPDGATVRSFPQPDGWDFNDTYVQETIHFLEAVAAGRATMAPLSAGRSALDIALAIRSR